MKTHDPINYVDVAFVVDTTGSMATLIAQAQRQMIEMIDRLTRAADIGLRLGVVEYRDHPPQDRMLTRVHAFDEDLAEVRKVIDGLRAGGGGDGPEAVLDGVLHACTELRWRCHARRLAVLVGDAPPHGVGAAGDAFRNGCPCGQTIESVTAAAEEARVTLYAIGLTPSVNESFQKLTGFTGGEFFDSRHAGRAIETLEQILANEFGQLELDRRVLEIWKQRDEFSIDSVAEELNRRPGEISAAITRLDSRSLLEKSEQEVELKL